MNLVVDGIIESTNEFKYYKYKKQEKNIEISKEKR